MFDQPCQHEQPFPHAQSEHVFGEADCAALEALFEKPLAWQARDDGFYSCHLCDVTAELSSDLKRRVLRRMRGVFALPLADDVVISAQRMEPGQAVGVHSDRPLLGYEVARLVLQLSRAHRPEHGGVLQLFEHSDGAPVVDIPPRYNTGFAFVLHAASFHGVTQTTAVRRSVVFNFWHVANTPALADAVEALFDRMRFGELPKGVDPIAVAAEAELSEETTLHASLVALALHRLGFDEASVVRGYVFGARGESDGELGGPHASAIRIADWLARLQLRGFDLKRWEQLAAACSGLRPDIRIAPLWQLCLPQT